MSHVNVLADEAVRDLVMPISVAVYHKLSAEGIIDERTELIEGIIFRKMTKSPLHAYIVNELRRFFEKSLPEDFILRKEDPITFFESEPEPDLAIVKGRHRDFIDHHPSTAELVIEIAISSEALDRQKLAVYAGAGIPECWLVLPERRLIEVYTDPLSVKQVYQHKKTVSDSMETLCGELILTDLFL